MKKAYVVIEFKLPLSDCRLIGVYETEAGAKAARTEGARVLEFRYFEPFKPADT